MKRSEVFFNLLAIPIDTAMIFASAVFAYYLRIRFDSVYPVLFSIDIGQYITTILMIMPFIILLFSFYSLYNIKSTDRLGKELTKIISAVTLAILFIVLIFFFDRDIFPSRLIILIAWITTIVFVGAGRVVLRKIRDDRLKRGYGLHKLAVISGPRTDISIIDYIDKNPEIGYGLVANLESSTINIMKELQKIYQESGLDEVLQADPGLSVSKSAELVKFCHDRGIRYNFVPDFFNVAATNIDVEMLSDVPVIKMKSTPLEGWGRLAKRFLDIVASVLALIILSPLYLIISLIVKLDSRGPIVYSAPRYGLQNSFMFYKFRTMYTHMSVGQGFGGEEAEKLRNELIANNARGGPLAKIKKDPRVTRFGRILRKTKLDELPQFWNVLKGDMSLVGPRAHVLDEVEKYREEYKRLFTIKPGITGMTQLAQMQRPNLPFEEEVKIDMYYIENWSLWSDIKVLFRTFWMLVAFRYSKEDF